MTAPPAGLQAYQKKEKHTRLKRSFQAHTAQVPDPALQRLRTKLEKGCISSTERHVLRMLETQTATQAQAAAKAKAAIKRAAQAEREPLTSAQIEARFKSRARAAEIAAAKVRTHYTPEGPNAEEQEAKAHDAAPHDFKKQRTSKSRSNQDYWDCYFHRNQRNARASKPQPAHQTCNDTEDEEDFDQAQFSSCDQQSDSDDDCIDLDSDEEGQEEYAGQQHPQSFYKQPPCMMSMPLAFQQLVSFVRQLPLRVKDEKAAAHLKTFEARKVLTKSDLSSAARRIWLAVHPDKNHAQAAQEATKAFGSLLDSLKDKGVL